MTSKRHFENIQFSSLQLPEHQKRVKRERSTDFWDNFIEDQKVGRGGNASGTIIKKEKQLDRDRGEDGMLQVDRQEIVEISDESMTEFIKQEPTEFQIAEYEEDPLMSVEQGGDPLKMADHVHESPCEIELEKLLNTSTDAHTKKKKLQSKRISIIKTETSSIDQLYSANQPEIRSSDSELPLIDYLLRPESDTFSQVPVEREEENYLKMEPRSETKWEIQSCMSFATQIHTQLTEPVQPSVDPLRPGKVTFSETSVKEEENSHLKMVAESCESRCETKLQIQPSTSLSTQTDTRDHHSSSSWHEGTFAVDSKKTFSFQLQPSAKSKENNEKILIQPKPSLLVPIDSNGRNPTKNPAIEQDGDTLRIAAEGESQRETKFQIQPSTSSAAKIDYQNLDSSESSLSELEQPLVSLPLGPDAGTFRLEKKLNIQAVDGKQSFTVHGLPSSSIRADKLPPSSVKILQTSPSELPPKDEKNSFKEKTTTPKTTTCLLSNILTKQERSFNDPLGPTIESTGPVNHVCCAINTLLIHKFTGSQWTDEQRRHIAYEDRRPVPIFKERDKEKKLYNTIKWLSGCNKLKKYVCWYCLLFSTKGVWSIGYDNKNFKKEADKHDVSVTHQENKRHFTHWKRGNRKKWKQVDSSSLISKLLTTEFLLWDDTKRTELLKNGKPYPTYEGTKKYLRRPLGNRQEVCRPAHHFKCFKTIPWLTGCLDINSTFCWPCLLFSPACAKLGTPLYNVGSSTTFEPLSTGATEHEKQKLHMKAYLRLRVRERELKETITLSTPTVVYDRMLKNRIFMKYFIDIICARKTQISNYVESSAEYESIARLISSHNKSLKIFSGDFEPNLTGVNHKFPEIVLSSIQHILMNEIKTEVQDSKFISCIIDSTSMSNRGFQVIIRYVDSKGEIQERFVGLLRLKRDELTPKELFKKIEAILNDKLNAIRKVIGFTYDGALLEPNDTITFNKYMRTNYPFAKFFHHRKHGWDILLQQTLAQLPYCTAFIRDLEQLSRFLANTQGAKEWILSLDQQHSNSMDSPGAFVRITRKHFALIVMFLETMVRQSESWKVKVVNQAYDFLEFMRPLHTRFLILMLAKINEIIEPLSKELEDEWVTSDKGSNSAAAVECIVKMNALSADFEDLYKIACDMLPPTQQSGSSYQIPKNKLEKQFDGIIEQVSVFIRNRDAEMEKGCFRANQLLTRQTPTDALRENTTISEWVPPELKLDEANLEVQLDFLRNDQHFGRKNSFVKLLHEHAMEDVTPDLIKLLQFVYAIPMRATDNCSEPANGGGIGALERMKTYVQSNSNFDFPDALMWMEKRLLTSLQSKKEFYASVIDHLANGPQSVGILAELK